MTFLNSMAQTLERAFMSTSIAQTRHILLGQSDRTLADAGISRELLERGNRAWPWRAAAPESEPSPAIAPLEIADTAERARRERLLRAAEELGRLDDRELADLGIGRGDIARAVRFGRPGIEFPDSDRLGEASRRHAA